MVVNVPKQVRQKNKKRRGTASQSHLLRKRGAAPLKAGRPQSRSRRRRSCTSPRAETRDTQTTASSAASLRLIARIAKYAQPIHRFGSRQFVVSKLPLERYCGRDQDRNGAEQKRKAAAAELTGDESRLHDQRRRQRRNEANARGESRRVRRVRRG